MLKIDVTKKYALAVSGGVDSMVMLHAFANYLPRPNFFVVTINHNIRKEAQSDCDFVQNYCKSIDVECKTFCVDIPTFAQENKISTETAARILRYQVLDGLDCDYVCLAHHQKDNAETVLLHLIRGSGTNGVQGIKQYNGNFFRPLLHVTKQQIVSYATQHNLPFVTDTTNDDNKYTRNYLRNQVLPLLAEICPTAEQNITRFAENASRDEEFLQSLADISTVVFDHQKATIPLELLNQPQPIAYRVVKKVLVKLGYHHDFEQTHYQSICQLANNVGGKTVCLPFDLVAINDYTAVTICKQQTNLAEQWQIPFAVGQTQTPLGVIHISPMPMQNALRLDVSQIPTTAVFRTRREGDVFKKFGGGTKPLKDYLIDKKIPQRERDSLVLLADGNNVLAILGVEIADTLKVTDIKNQYYTKLI